jgi:ubiquinone/menaquinone biosynthesis C-methylase UbiE
VGKSGKVIGVDMTEEMLEKARKMQMIMAIQMLSS